MAYNPNELFQTAAGNTSPRTIIGRVQPKKFAAGTGTLAVNAPVAFNTSSNSWAPWDADGSNGTNTCKGFVGPDPIVLDSDEEVLGNVIMEGTIHVDDVKAATSEADGDVETMLKTQARPLGFYVQGLEGVR